MALSELTANKFVPLSGDIKLSGEGNFCKMIRPQKSYSLDVVCPTRFTCRKLSTVMLGGGIDLEDGGVEGGLTSLRALPSKGVKTIPWRTLS